MGSYLERPGDLCEVERSPPLRELDHLGSALETAELAAAVDVLAVPHEAELEVLVGVKDAWGLPERAEPWNCLLRTGFARPVAGSG